MKNYKKGAVTIVVLLIVIFLVIGCGIYFYLQSKNTNQGSLLSLTQSSEQKNPISSVQTQIKPIEGRYVIERDIKNLKYFDTDIYENCNGSYLMIRGQCKLYKADYALNGNELTQNTFGAVVEIPSGLAKDKFINTIESIYKGKIEKKTSLSNDHYVLTLGHDSGVSKTFIWYSDGKLIGVGGLNPTDKTSGSIEDLLEVYLPIYPSELKWE